MVSRKIICDCQGKILDKACKVMYDTSGVKQNDLTGRLLWTHWK